MDGGDFGQDKAGAGGNLSPQRHPRARPEDRPAQTPCPTSDVLGASGDPRVEPDTRLNTEASDVVASLDRHGPARPDHQPEHTGESEFGHTGGPVDPPIKSGEDHDALSTVPFHDEARASWTRVGTIDEIPRLGSRVVKARGADIAVFRTADDRVFALLDRCPHKQGKLSQGIVHGTSVTCPLHNWVIGLDDGLAKDPDEGCVNTIPVRLDGNTILLALPA